MRAHRELIKEMHVDVQVALAAGEASSDQRLLHLRGLGDTDAAVVQIRTGSAFGSEQLIARGIENYAGDQLVFMLERNGDIEHRKSMREVRCAIQWIDVPAVGR